MSSADRDILESDRIFLDAMSASNDAFERALSGQSVGKFRPKCIYTPTNTPPPQDAFAIRREQESKTLAAIRRERERIEGLRVGYREPCTHCGVRGDVGCNHQVAA